MSDNINININQVSWKELGDITILVVEDDPFNQLLVKSLLKKFSEIHIIEAYDGAEALKIILTNIKIDIILLDLHMPTMNGYEFLEELKKDDKSYLVPIIFAMTTDENEKRKLYSHGVDGFISKPFNIEELEIKIYSAIKSKIEKAKDKSLFHTNDDIENSQKDFFCRMVEVKNKSNIDIKFQNEVIATIAKEFALLLGYNFKVASNIYCASKIRDIGLIGFNQDMKLDIKFSIEDKKKYNEYILCGYKMMNSHIETNFLKITKKIILQYRESYDGSGTPSQLKFSQISKKAMIVGMAETFEALLSIREYRDKKVYSSQETYNVFKYESGKRFSPELTKVFLKNFYTFIKLRKQILLK
ncbi:TWO-COMPONENT HYBRID SENSOR AND REGULATOR [hydrothermal vent metagenome]|uniref:TWO-COMPONENT HYBRID SENSOR AND REGULATOR n=1 Tax=hydrothermal vent metagenome TaxID=652676 RepID=A0A1W1C593_9ZZZZ